MRCEDYPCCGHTDNDPCDRQWYDEPGAFDTTIPGNEHRLCDHENGDCDVDDYDDGCPDCGELSDDCLCDYDPPGYDPREDLYWPGTGELQSDESYINYLNNY